MILYYIKLNRISIFEHYYILFILYYIELYYFIIYYDMLYVILVKIFKKPTSPLNKLILIYLQIIYKIL